MAQTFFFYDLETSGLRARDDRIMQFAGQRTDMDLRPIGEPINVLVSLSDDILPSPDAIMVTGITPQSTQTDGYTEAQFCRLLMDEVFTPDTIAVGYNNVRFDDEFIRHTLWRNFYDPYEWAWSEGRSRWDLLDVVRMTRALRPDGLEWPVDESGKAVNKLELLAAANGLVHDKAHDALSDVEALIALTGRIKQAQPKLFDYLLTMRNKKKLLELINLDTPTPCVYTSGRYDAAHDKTTVAYPLAPGPHPSSVLMYDLRVDPTPFLRATPKQLAETIFASRDARSQEGFVPLPVKELNYGRCPAIAPLGVLDDATQQRLEIDLEVIQKHQAVIVANPGFAGAVREAYELREPYETGGDVESRLYDGFIPDQDKTRLSVVRAADAQSLADFHPQFLDERYDTLLLRYKARNFPVSLSEDEHTAWEQYRAQKLQSHIERYLESLERLRRQGADSYILEELHLWVESILPATD